MARKASPRGMSTVEFARKIGQHPQTIRDAIKGGRLPSVRKVGRDYVIRDYALTYREYFGVDPPDDAPPEPETDEPEGVPVDASAGPAGVRYRGETMHASAAEEKFWRAKLAELDYRRREGALIERSLAAEQYVQEVVSCRTKLLGLPSRLKQRALLTEEQARLCEDLVREALEALSDGLADAPPEDDGTSD